MIISPWAKLVSPVVPKITDSPIAASARMRPNRRPLASSWGRSSKPIAVLLAPASGAGASPVTIWNATGLRCNGFTVVVAGLRSGLIRLVPSGSESTSTATA